MQTKPVDVPYCNVREEVIAHAQPRLHAGNVQQFYDFVVERYTIHLKKDVQRLAKPWTSNAILQKYRFTNVRREQDRETRWLIEHICTNQTLSYPNKLLNIILFRLINKSETFSLFGPLAFETIPYATIEQQLGDWRDAHPEYIYFSNAFYTSGPKAAANKLFGKSDNVMNAIKLVEHYARAGIIARIDAAPMQQAVYEALRSLQGLGRFLAYQIFVDFCYMKEFPFSENEFVVAGPGCIKGLQYLFKNFDGMSYEEALFWLRDNQQRVLGTFGYTPLQLFSDLARNERYLNVMSLQNCMCELSKYLRAVRGEGRPRIRYAGT